MGLAGGGTDVSPYADTFGGAVLNATINLYAYSTLIPTDDGRIIIESVDKGERFESDPKELLPIDGRLDILKAIYNRVVRDFAKRPMGFKLSTYVDVPPGSGLGASSTLVVAVLGAFAEWLKLPLGEYDLAHLAYEIERVDLKMAGGRQDQYAATFGGFNFIEFFNADNVVVNPLRIKEEYMNELGFNLVLYYTGTSRLSSTIIESQKKSVIDQKESSVSAMHRLKEQAVLMKEAILKGNLGGLGEILDYGWTSKKKLADEVSNDLIDEIYETAKKAGATGGKLTGAGGGGFMVFYCPGDARYRVIDALQKFGGNVRRFQFVKNGLTSWEVKPWKK